MALSGRGLAGLEDPHGPLLSRTGENAIAQLLNKPPKFLTVRARVLAPEAAPPVLAMCAGYDEQRWRAKALVEHLCQWIPEWALRYGELNERLDSATLMAMSRRAALKVYTSKNFEGRGEFGEIMLHAVIRQEFDTHPAISKIFFKDRANDYVKGFDCVHVSTNDQGGLDLWLGEAKFYVRRGQAIAAVAKDLREHLTRDFLREEFALVLDKVDGSFPFADQLHDLISANRPLDEIFTTVRIPVLLAYDSKTIRDHREVSADFEEAMKADALAASKSLGEKIEDKKLPREVSIELILLPVEDKKQLTKLLDTELRNWQGRAN